ncbi:MAG: sigma-70 family RNA polymerase sigma factor [Acidobacteria bacterium]|nr:sigma-70 family RNA polymerase sigma factor [Acidobacteriota bacterium]
MGQGDGALEPDWGRIRTLALWTASRFERDRHLAEDVAQDAAVRLWLAVRAGVPVRRHEDWIRGTVRNLCLDEAAKDELLTASRARPCNLDLVEGASWADPENRAILTDLWSAAPVLLRGLPPPCAEIATLQIILEWTREEIIDWMRAWRPVGREECRRQLKRTHRMLRGLARGELPPLAFRSAVVGLKNRWATTPPPPFRRLRG